MFMQMNPLFLPASELQAPATPGIVSRGAKFGVRVKGGGGGGVVLQEAARGERTAKRVAETELWQEIRSGML